MSTPSTVHRTPKLGSRISIDVGGTFTDFVYATLSGDIHAYKVLTTPKDPSIGVFEGLELIAVDHHRSVRSLLSEIGMIIHSTTITTNAIITGQYAKVGLIVTKGFRDTLEMRRGYKEKLYDIKYLPPKPPVPRHLRKEVDERIEWNGNELTKLSLEDIGKSISAFKNYDVEAIAICFLHSYKNPKHEREAKIAIENLVANLHISISSEVIPEVKFYERMATTIFNANVAKLLVNYLDSLERKLSEGGFSGSLLIMQSNAGMMSTAAAKAKPCLTISSGPGSGAIAAAAYGSMYRRSNCLGVDMGGTTCIVTVVRDGKPFVTTESEFNRQHLLIPMIETNTIGAGGGSIAWVDPGAMLRVGPQSAASYPGPACYGMGGEDPTVTDADLLLGYINPAHFWGGKLKLDKAKAERTITEKLGVKIGLSVKEAAAGIFKLVNTNMSTAVREVTAKKGLDPRKHLLILGGGAGPIHGAAILEELQMPAAIMPRESGAYTSIGMLLSDIKHDFVVSYQKSLQTTNTEEIKSIFLEMESKGRSLLESEGIESAKSWFETFLDLRYVGQYHEITISVNRDELADNLSAVQELFHRKHDELYGYYARDDPVEMLNLRCTAHGAIPPLKFREQNWSSKINDKAKLDKREIYLNAKDEFCLVQIYDCKSLVWGNIIDGPVIIEHPHTELVVDSPFSVAVGKYGDLIMYEKDRSKEFTPMMGN